MGENRIRWDVVWYWGFLNVLQSPNFQTFEPNSEIGAVNERTIELLQTSSQHYCKALWLVSYWHLARTSEIFHNDVIFPLTDLWCDSQ